jgi:16S rRNA (cytidine1402-2'-O)-methyltransferase
MAPMQATESGTLFVVATPIGNLNDISSRAIEVLKSVDMIVAEDTRHSLPLLTALGIKKPLTALHAHNEEGKSQSLVQDLLAGKSLALISDAGTPLISDPGFSLVSEARKLHITVVPIPGACAITAALSAAGVACDTFVFAGFLPAKQAARKAKLSTLMQVPHTLVVYESTHRILECIEDIIALLGEQCALVLAKELTKSHERFISGTGQDIKAYLLADPAHVKGEFVLIIPARPLKTDDSAHADLLSLLLEELPLKQAVSIAAKISGANKNSLYDMALQLKKH